jgi:hypothetical protein
VANSVAPLVALLTQAGIQADEAGTGVKTMIMEFAKSGKFTTIENMVKDLEKMKKLDPVKLLGTFEKAFGKEHASKALIVAAGGYGDLVKKMENMASMDQKISNQMAGLTAIFDAMTGTIQNAGAALGMVYAPELKAAAQWVNVSADMIRGWIGENSTAIKTAIGLAGAFVGVKLMALGVAGALGVINTVMKANPWYLFAQLAVTAASLIYTNWEPISDFFKENLGGAIESVMSTYKSFMSVIESSRGILTDAFMWADKTFSAMNAPAANGMRPPGYTKNIVGSNKVSGGIDVNFNNAPSGMRVAPAQTKGPVSVTPNVGYRTIGTAAGG